MRAKLVVFAGAALIAAAIVVDATSVAVPPKPAAVRVAGSSGILACPMAVPTTGRVALHLANIGDDDGKARVVIRPDRGRAAVLDVDVPARAVRTVRLHGRVEGAAGVFVHYIGSIIASHTAWLSDGAYGGTCQPAGPRRTVLAHGTTAGATTTLAVANPGNADTDVSISLLLDGQRIEPETLRRFIVPAQRRRLFQLGDFAFEASDLTVVVQTEAGRVVAQLLTQSRYGAASISGTPARADAVTLVGLGDGPRAVSVAAIGEDEDAAVDARVLAEGSQGAASGVPPAIAPADSVRLSVRAPRERGVLAYAVDVTAGSPIASAGSWRRGGGDRAAVESTGSSTRWAGVIGLDPTGQARVLLANPGSSSARLHLTMIGQEGVTEEDLTLDAGRAGAHLLGTGRGTFAVIVESDVPIGAALDAITRGSALLVAVPAIPQPPPRSVAVRQDPQAGVPGRRPGT